MLYVAYGSNINKDQMNFRVPSAKPCGTGIVYNWELSFHGKVDGNGYATLVQSPGKHVPVVLWELSSKDEAIMDKYEGYPKAYYKKKIPVHINGEKKTGVVYIMNEDRPVARPSRKYVNTVRLGYESFGLDTSYLQEALERNSREYYLADLLEVRDYNPVKVKSKKCVNRSQISKFNSRTAKMIQRGSIWKDSKGSVVPENLSTYMRKTFPTDPYWGSTYGRDDDYVEHINTGSKKKPSLDDYDWID